MSANFTRGALGLKLHTGWAALVALTGDPSHVNVIVRRRLELLPTDGSIPRFVYHRAAELGISAGSELVKSAERAAQETAKLALTQILRSFDLSGIVINAAGIIAGSAGGAHQLPAILASHALIHAAEGRLFEQAAVTGCASCGIGAITVRARDLWCQAASAHGLDESVFRACVDALGRSVGPPWGADQKGAAAAALLVLQTK